MRDHPGGLSGVLRPLPPLVKSCPAPGQDLTPEVLSSPVPCALSFQMSRSTLAKRTMTWLKSE